MSVAVTAAALVVVAGCGSIERQETETKENLLSAAGFTMLAADTPAKQAQVQAMQQHTMLRKPQPDGSLQFVYADASDCRCLFVGNQQNYQQYQRLALRREQAIAMQEAALDADEAGMYNWGMWGYPGW
jgi:hypothetical protein